MIQRWKKKKRNDCKCFCYSNIGIAKVIHKHTKHTKQWISVFLFILLSTIPTSEITWGYELLFWTWRCNSNVIVRDGAPLSRIKTNSTFNKFKHKMAISFINMCTSIQLKLHECVMSKRQISRYPCNDRILTKWINGSLLAPWCRIHHGKYEIYLVNEET